VPLFNPVAATTDNTAWVSNIIDTAGYEAVTLAFQTGTLTDADATFAVTMEHGDAANLSDTAAPASTDLVGTLALAGFTFADDNKARKIGYVGSKRYVRLTVTPSEQHRQRFPCWRADSSPRAQLPTANPPQ
jgi:hypothetical protein